MTDQKKNQLAALLMERDAELREDEYRATNKRDFETLKTIITKRDIITQALANLF